nr:hypothetical protein BaRGS_022682 [Batillaria attramentaria]
MCVIHVCFQLVDRLLEQASLTSFSDVTQAVDIVLTPDNQALQNFLEAFVEAADSPYGCLMVAGRVAVATQKWWNLSATELVLLELLVAAMTPCASRDVPIYLPQGSPTVPRFWRPAVDLLKSAYSVTPRNFPPSIPMDQNILG